MVRKNLDRKRKEKSDEQYKFGETKGNTKEKPPILIYPVTRMFDLLGIMSPRLAHQGQLAQAISRKTTHDFRYFTKSGGQSPEQKEGF